jgi:hypothetical protein
MSYHPRKLSEPFEPVTLAEGVGGGPWPISTSTENWFETAFDLLLGEANVEIDGILVRARDMHPRRPVLRQLRAILRRHGIRVGRLP